MRERPREDEPASASTDPLAETQAGDSGRTIHGGAEGGAAPAPSTHASPELDTRAFTEGSASEGEAEHARSASDGPAGHAASGDRIGRYRLVSARGLGGMGLVYLARHLGLEEPVARLVTAQRAHVDWALPPVDLRRALRAAALLTALASACLEELFTVLECEAMLEALHACQLTPSYWDEHRLRLIAAYHRRTSSSSHA